VLYVANEEQTLRDALSFLVVSVWYDCVIVQNITETFSDDGREELTRLFYKELKIEHLNTQTDKFNTRNVRNSS
jgi:hypothetical protein